MPVKSLIIGIILALTISIPQGIKVLDREEPELLIETKIPEKNVQIREYDLNLPEHYKLTEENIENYKKKKVVLYGKENPMYLILPEDLKNENVLNPVEAEILEPLQNLALPVDPEYFNIVSGYGTRVHPINGNSGIHWGIDISAEGIENKPVYAVLDGVIEFAGTHETYGKMVRIAHENGKIKSIYAHLKEIPENIYPAVHVKKGQIIGRVGNTGLSTGPHLHFELRIPVNPQIYLKKGAK